MWAITATRGFLRAKCPRAITTRFPNLYLRWCRPTIVWPRLLEKVAEYLDAGVTVVCVVDPRNETIQVHRADVPVQHMQGDDELTFPDVLPGFSLQGFAVL